jgi:pimeloyl-ACP methyl ester carboxylesterase
MKKIFIRLIVVLAILVLSVFVFVIPKTVSMVTDYPRFTHDDVFDNPELLAHFDINEARDPGDYGFENFTEVNYETLYDGLNLNGWYIPSSKAGIEKTLMINHGRTSNRLKTMKYLEIIKDYGLDSLYNIFMPDLRNSGKSDEAKTGMGYEFAEDITGTMKMLQSKFNQNDFVLWGFSMGAMGSITSINRPDLKKKLIENGIQINKLILASPLANVEKTLSVAAKQRNIPGFIFNITFKKFSKISDGYVDEMRLSNFLRINPTPTLVLYGTGDSITPFEILEEEIAGLSNVDSEKFEGSEHVLIYTQAQYKARYAEVVNDFLRK